MMSRADLMRLPSCWVVVSGAASGFLALGMALPSYYAAYSSA